MEFYIAMFCMVFFQAYVWFAIGIGSFRHTIDNDGTVTIQLHMGIPLSVRFRLRYVDGQWHYLNGKEASSFHRKACVAAVVKSKFKNEGVA